MKEKLHMNNRYTNRDATSTRSGKYFKADWSQLKGSRDIRRENFQSILSEGHKNLFKCRLFC